MEVIFTVEVRQTIEPQLDAFLVEAVRNIKPYCEKRSNLPALRIDDNGVEVYGEIEIGNIRSFYYNDLIFLTPRFLTDYLVDHDDPDEIVPIVEGEITVYAQVKDKIDIDDIEAELSTNFTFVLRIETIDD